MPKKTSPKKAAKGAPVQTEFTVPQWNEFLKTELGKAVQEVAAYEDVIRKKKLDQAVAVDRVLIEMKKTGRDKIRPQLDGVFWTFEIKKGSEKLKFKRGGE